MHEESADARRKAERKQKRAIKRGAAPATNVRKARRERAIEELAVGVAGVTRKNGRTPAPGAKESAATAADSPEGSSAASSGKRPS
jgi:hypothetical protein